MLDSSDAGLILFKGGLVHSKLDLFIWSWTVLFKDGLICSTLDAFVWSWTHSLDTGLVCLKLDSFIQSWTHLFDAGLDHLKLDLFVWHWTCSFDASCSQSMLNSFDAGLVGHWTHWLLDSFSAGLLVFSLTYLMHLPLNQCNSFVNSSFWLKSFNAGHDLFAASSPCLCNLFDPSSPLLLAINQCNSFATSLFSTSPCFMQLVCCFLHLQLPLFDMTCLLLWLILHFLSFSTTLDQHLPLPLPTSYPPAMQTHLPWGDEKEKWLWMSTCFHGTTSMAIVSLVRSNTTESFKFLTILWYIFHENWNEQQMQQSREIF